MMGEPRAETPDHPIRLMTDHFGGLHKMVPADFYALLRRLSKPGRYCPRVAKVLSTPAPWDDDCDKTSTPEDR